MTILSRYKIIFPPEHGSWSMLVMPLVMGAGVAGQFPLALWLLGVATLVIFLVRQPVTILVRIGRGKARPSDGLPARFWGGLLLVIAASAGGALLLMGRWAILWLAVPGGCLLVITLALGTWLGPRQLMVELLGAVGLALAAPAAYVAATGNLNRIAWQTGLLSAIYSIISVLYVRLRIDESHQRASSSQRVGVIAAHAVSLAGVIGGALMGWIHFLVIFPLAALLLRAVYVVWRRPVVQYVRRFGLVETGFALAFAGLVIVAFGPGQ